MGVLPTVNLGCVAVRVLGRYKNNVCTLLHRNFTTIKHGLHALNAHVANQVRILCNRADKRTCSTLDHLKHIIISIIAADLDVAIFIRILSNMESTP